ncbi:FAD-dependent oxidoreductase [Nocardiopsis mangrovi]|uniref:FAD-dependent oxidoreductase n=1 Tax=Nocardiopsis mangrovi TaxID=1179818 RepID=A0ABV9E3W5_9ACTN
MDDPVVIVGAGPVGMLLACDLLQQGVPVRVIDAAREHSAHSRAAVIWPRVLEVLRRTGVAERMVTEGHRIEGVTYFSSGRELGTAWMTRLTDTPYPFAVGIAQSHTERIIEDRLTELGGKIERGARLTAVRESAGPRPVAVLEGTDGGVQEVETPWLIGADGAHSTLRKLLGITFEGEQFHVSFSITDAQLAGDAPMNVVSYCYTPQGSLALGPLGPDVSRVAVSVPHPEGDDPPAPPTREFFQGLLDSRAPGRNTIGEMRFSTTFQVHARVADSYKHGHCLLIGDAAHTLSPAGAQGLNTGLQDVGNLGWRLGGHLTGRLSEDAVAGYDRDRREGARQAAWSTARQSRWGFYTKPAQIAVRDVVFRGAHAAGLVQRAVSPIVAQTTVHYPATDAPAGGAKRRGGGVAPGERLPVLLSGPGDEPSELPQGGWVRVAPEGLTVLLHPGTAASVRPGWAALTRRVAEAARGRAAVVSAGVRGPLAAALGARPAIAVARPDGHLLATLTPEQAAELPKVLGLLAERPDPLTDPVAAAAAATAAPAH